MKNFYQFLKEDDGSISIYKPESFLRYVIDQYFGNSDEPVVNVGWLDVRFSGGYHRATRDEPEEFPEIELELEGVSVPSVISYDLLAEDSDEPEDKVKDFAVNVASKQPFTPFKIVAQCVSENFPKIIFRCDCEVVEAIPKEDGVHVKIKPLDIYPDDYNELADAAFEGAKDARGQSRAEDRYDRMQDRY